MARMLPGVWFVGDSVLVVLTLFFVWGNSCLRSGIRDAARV